MRTKRVIVDTDPGVDYVMALLLALPSSELQLEGVAPVFGPLVVFDPVPSRGLPQATR